MITAEGLTLDGQGRGWIQRVILTPSHEHAGLID